MASQFKLRLNEPSPRCSIRLTACASLLLASTVLAQGGGNANSIGLSVEAAANAAAATSAGSGSSASSSGSPGSSGSSAVQGRPEMNQPNGDSSSSYGDSSSGYGSQPVTAGSGAQRTQLIMLGLSQQLAKSIASTFAEPQGVSSAEGRQLTLWEQAALAFHQGDQKKALALYHAHIVSDGDAASDARASVEYSRLLKRPVWVVRFGISIHPRVPPEFEADPQPIRESTKIAATGRGRGAMGRGGPPDDGSGRPPEEFNRGDDGRMSDPRGSESGGPNGAKPVVTALGGSATEQAKSAIDRNLGLVAEVTQELFTGLQSTGKFGRALDSMESKGAQLAALKQEFSDASPSDLPMWIPGVDFVGEGAAPDMLVQAKTSGIDVLMHFDVIVKENRTGPPQYTTRCKLLLVDSGETIVISKAIDKFEIASKPTGNRESIQEIMKAMFDVIDKKVSVEPMPALQAQHAAARIETLLAAKKRDSLRNLAEMVMFRSRDLITPEQLDQAFYFAGGDQALALLHEEEVDRYERVNNYVDRELNVDAEK